MRYRLLLIDVAVDRDVTGMLAGERFLLPVGPPLDELHSGQLRHEVEFAGPAVADVNRDDPHPVVSEYDLAGIDGLFQGSSSLTVMTTRSSSAAAAVIFRRSV